MTRTTTWSFPRTAGGESCTGTSADSLFFGDTGINLDNGGTGFARALDDTQAAAVDAACGAALAAAPRWRPEATILRANDGPDSFLLVNIRDVCDPNVPGIAQDLRTFEPITL
jgi:hypothetical protein